MGSRLSVPPEQVSGGDDMTLHDVRAVGDTLALALHPDARVIFAASVDPSMEDEIMVTVIATGFLSSPPPLPPPPTLSPSLPPQKPFRESSPPKPSTLEESAPSQPPPPIAMPSPPSPRAAPLRSKEWPMQARAQTCACLPGPLHR